MAFGNEGKENARKEVRNSHRISKVSTLKKTGNKSGLPKKIGKNINTNMRVYKQGSNEAEAIEEESEVFDSNVVTQRSHDKVGAYSGQKGTKRSNNKGSTMLTQKNKLTSKEKGTPDHYQPIKNTKDEEEVESSSDY